MRLSSGLTVFTRTNSPGYWNIAAYHSPHSLTWRWVLSFARQRRDGNFLWPLLWWYRLPNGCLHWGFRIPLIGTINWQAQEPMWYRDMYMKLRTRVDQEDGMLWLPDNHPEKIHREPQKPPIPPNIVPGPGTIN